MSYRDVVTVWKVTRCDSCGQEDTARTDEDGESYPPAGWRELPTGEHACSRRCVDLLRERKERAA